MNDIHFGEDYFSILNDGLDDLFRNCDVPAPHPAVQRSPLGPMPTLTLRSMSTSISRNDP